MQNGIRILNRILSESKLQPYTIEQGIKKSRAYAKVRHPKTGVIAIFNATNSANRDTHATQNELSRMRRFHKHGHEHMFGRAY